MKFKINPNEVFEVLLKKENLVMAKSNISHRCKHRPEGKDVIILKEDLKKFRRTFEIGIGPIGSIKKKCIGISVSKDYEGRIRRWSNAKEAANIKLIFKRIVKMDLKIQKDLIKAMKEKDSVSKTALKGIKADLKKEEINKGSELTRPEKIKILAKAVKQREQSALEYKKANRLELAEQEELEAKILSKYLPSKMATKDIEENLKDILDSIEMPNAKAKIGRAIGAFNNKFPGEAEVESIRRIAEKILGV